MYFKFGKAILYDSDDPDLTRRRFVGVKMRRPAHEARAYVGYSDKNIKINYEIFITE